MSDVVEKYLARCQHAKGLARTTVSTYRTTLSQFRRQFHGRDMARLTTVDIQAFLVRGEREGGSVQASTKRKELATIRQLFDYMKGLGLIDLDPAHIAVSPKVSNSHPKPVDDYTWTAFWKVMRYLDRVAWGLGYYCGLRRAEIATLAPHHVSPLVGRFMGFKRKGGGDDVLDYAECVGVVADHPALPAARPRRLPRRPGQAGHRPCGEALLRPVGRHDARCPRARFTHALPEGACHPPAGEQAHGGGPGPSSACPAGCSPPTSCATPS